MNAAEMKAKCSVIARKEVRDWESFDPKGCSHLLWAMAVRIFDAIASIPIEPERTVEPRGYPTPGACSCLGEDERDTRPASYVDIQDEMVVAAMEHVPGCDHDDMVRAIEAALAASKPLSAAVQNAMVKFQAALIQRERAEKADAQIAALREALTPSGETKMAYSGEFKFTRSWINDFGNDTVEKLTVPWTTIKDIMAAIRARAAASTLVKPGPASEPKT